MNEKSTDPIIKVVAFQTVSISICVPVSDTLWNKYLEDDEAYVQTDFIASLKGHAERKLVDAGYPPLAIETLTTQGPIFRTLEGNVRAVFFGIRPLKEGDDLWPLRDDDPEGLA